MPWTAGRLDAAQLGTRRKMDSQSLQDRPIHVCLRRDKTHWQPVSRLMQRTADLPSRRNTSTWTLLPYDSRYNGILDLGWWHSFFFFRLTVQCGKGRFGNYEVSTTRHASFLSGNLAKDFVSATTGTQSQFGSRDRERHFIFSSFQLYKLL